MGAAFEDSLIGELTPLFVREADRKKLVAAEWVRQRYVMCVMGLLALLNCFGMRICLTLALSDMNPSPSSGNSSSDETCPYETSTSNSTSDETTDKEYPFNWSQEEQGFILSAFYIGYIVTHLPGGMIADRWGGKHTLGLGVLCTAICTFLTPLAANLGQVGGMIAVRIVMGLGEGVTFPALYVLLAKWAPEQERSTLGSVILAGAQLGTLFGNILTGFLLQGFGWEITFYVYGALGVAWCFFWYILCYSDPFSHPFISEKELKFLEENVTSLQSQEKTGHVKTPWRAMALSLPVWCLVLTETGHDWGFYTMVTDLPKYMSDVLHFDIDESGVLSSLPFLVMWICSMVLSVLADWIAKKGYFTVTTIRKFFTTIASIGPGVFLLAASYAGCERSLVVILFCIGMGTMGAFYPGMRVNALDLSPRHAGTIGALMNGIGSLAGIAAPSVIGIIAQHGLLSEWRVVFWINFVIMAVTNLAFLLGGSAEVQWWDDPNAVAPSERTARARAKEAEAAM